MSRTFAAEYAAAASNERLNPTGAATLESVKSIEYETFFDPSASTDEYYGETTKPNEIKRPPVRGKSP